ncbi:hypothetical protein DUI87_07603 [Hirundo rustica rustica]|uniref:Uncharacterized protein n=1 Tax=Hirundo rustica rustica TaxID=333673 RepID=A0A3M0KQ46_HIRRU|nr:hypothetical protein DUI87_07603 [Hirundo rustica rustica]
MLKSSTAERDLGGLVGGKLNMSQQCPGSQEGMGGDCPALLCTEEDSPGVLGAQYKKDIKILKSVERRAKSMVEGLKGKPHQKRLRLLDLLSLEKRKHRGNPIAVYNFLEKGRGGTGAKYPPNLKGGDFIVAFLQDKASKDHYSFVVKND